MPQGPTYRLQSFAELSTDQLYGILHLRSAVFVVEQNCAYQDMDGRDEGSLHLSQSVGTELVGYARLLPAGLDFPGAAAIGRVVTSPAYRGRKLGRRLVAESIRRCAQRWPAAPIYIRAQTYLLNFYGSFGFVATGPEYLEDGIPHQDMHLLPG